MPGIMEIRLAKMLPPPLSNTTARLVTGAKLPLYVVIDRQGKIAHYHAGFYEVNRDRGLEELSNAVRQALDKRN